MPGRFGQAAQSRCACLPENMGTCMPEAVKAQAPITRGTNVCMSALHRIASRVVLHLLLLLLLLLLRPTPVHRIDRFGADCVPGSENRYQQFISVPFSHTSGLISQGQTFSGRSTDSPELGSAPDFRGPEQKREREKERGKKRGEGQKGGGRGSPSLQLEGCPCLSSPVHQHHPSVSQHLISSHMIIGDAANSLSSCYPKALKVVPGEAR